MFLAKFASRSPEPTFERDRGRWVQALLPAALDFIQHLGSRGRVFAVVSREESLRSTIRIELGVACDVTGCSMVPILWIPAQHVHKLVVVVVKFAPLFGPLLLPGRDVQQIFVFRNFRNRKLPKMQSHP